MMIEIVCCSAEDCVIAAEAGADQIELCSAIALGGLTPSLGTFRAARAVCSLPLMVMIRPRGAGFAYSDLEFAAMREDVQIFREAGADGVVFGVLKPTGEIDFPRMRELAEAAGPMQKVCHRCFDVTPDPFQALETLIELGFDRVLTSGQRASALDALPLLRELRERAAGRIEVLPAGGLRAVNVDEFVDATGTRLLHLGPFENVPDTSTHGNPEIFFGISEVPPEDSYGRLDASAVRAVVHAARLAPES